MNNGPKFSGSAHVIFADIMGDDLSTIERILGRRNTKAHGLAGKCLLFERRMRLRGPSFPLSRGHRDDHEKARSQ